MESDVATAAWLCEDGPFLSVEDKGDLKSTQNSVRTTDYVYPSIGFQEPLSARVRHLKRQIQNHFIKRKEPTLQPQSRYH